MSHLLTVLDQSNSHLYQREALFTNGDLDEKLPILIERDQDIEDRFPWKTRITLFESAYRINELFSISIAPQNPRDKQTLYFKKAPQTRAPIKCRELTLDQSKPYLGLLFPVVDPEMNSATDEYPDEIRQPLKDSLEKVVSLFYQDRNSSQLGLSYIQDGTLYRQKWKKA